MKIAGVVTLYHPNENVADNLKTYASYLNELYIILNSEIPFDIMESLRGFKNVVIVNMQENSGIAIAINTVLFKIKDEYTWCLTMDQDSFFYEGEFERYLSILKNVDEKKVYGITSIINGEKNYGDSKLIVVERCITSGMLLNVNLALECGGMNEKLFIDNVDHEFCYRCNDRGYRLLLYTKSIMYHCIGETREYNILGFKFMSENEKYFRLYYIYRNTLYVMNRYPYIRWRSIVSLCKRFIKVILVEGDKVRKIRYIIKGVHDYFSNKMGKMNY